jgi:hypothetical protein
LTASGSRLLSGAVRGFLLVASGLLLLFGVLLCCSVLSAFF